MANAIQNTFNESFRPLSNVDPITPDELASLVMTDNGTSMVRVVDCRASVAFNTNHVVGAFNATCGDWFLTKRLTQQSATVAQLVGDRPLSSKEVGGPREAYRFQTENVYSSPTEIFVCYDDNTSDLKLLRKSHPLQMLVSSLRGSGYCAKYLVGGLQAFYARYSWLCSRRDDLKCCPTPVDLFHVKSVTMSQILPFLFLGNKKDAANRQLLDDAGVNHVINVTPRIPLYFCDDEMMTYVRIPASDNSYQNIKQFFSDAVYFIESARRSGGKVLVHCRAGVSRSATIVVAYLMARYGLSMMDTLQLVKHHRNIIAPNRNFMGQLLEFEECCRRGEMHDIFNYSSG